MAEGLRHDLETIERRRALVWLASGGTALLAARGRPSAAATREAELACMADPRETRGPYPADGTRDWGPRVPNVLADSRVVRSDIRSSFVDSSTVAPGVPLRLTLTVVDVNAGCRPLAGHAAYLWQCDRDGRYSLYDLPGESYLRGLQVTDGRGQASFTTIFPATYPGRYPHMHFEIFRSAADAGHGRNAVLVSQLMMPPDVSAHVYARAAGYGSSRGTFRNLSPASDFVLHDNDARELAAMTPRFTGEVATGLVATTEIGIAA